MFSKIASGDSSVWKDPSVTKANQYLQDLSEAGAFGDNASSVNYDQGSSTALLYTGKAAMEVMGTWEYANIAKAAPDKTAARAIAPSVWSRTASGRDRPGSSGRECAAARPRTTADRKQEKSTAQSRAVRRGHRPDVRAPDSNSWTSADGNSHRHPASP